MIINKFQKNRSLELSKMFFDKLENKLDNLDLDGHYNVFNNCREQGLVLTLYNVGNTPDLNIWACECRNTDDLMIVIGNEKDRDTNAMFSENAYNERKFFNVEDVDSALKYVIDKMRVTFPKAFVRPANFNFECNYKLEDLERIVIDANSLDYEDYHDLATFDDLNENYFCDLIIMDGEIGLRYSKVSDRNNNDYENLTFEKYEPNLESELSLMIGMKERLDHFITNEKEYELEMNSDIKI
jgi:hypothetical protein